MRDIFIDNNIAKDFATPVNEHYKALIEWLLKFNNNTEDAYLVLSKKILKEYLDSSRNCLKSTAITVIVSDLTKQGRINSFTNAQIKEFSDKHYSAKVLRKLRSNGKDRNHIPIVLMSNRKMAITKDQNFAYDLVNFPNFEAVVTDCPSKIEYR